MHCNIPFPDLPSRLEGTICMYIGEPFIVRTNGCLEEDEDGCLTGTLHLYDMLDNGRHLATIDSRDPNFDIATPPLGYCQSHPKRVSYVTRKPWRKWKQGITWDGLYVEGINHGNDFHLYSNSAREMMMQRYTPLQNTLEIIKMDNEYKERAVNNDVALQADNGVVNVWFRNELVGYTPRLTLGDDMTITVPNSRKAWVVNRYLSAFNFNVLIK